MIVEFSVANFRSIKEMQTISFAATKLDSSDKNAQVDSNNVVEVDGMRLLKTVGIYGPNASGKSNIISAYEYFIAFIVAPPSPKPLIIQRLNQPFIYQDDFQTTDSFFQIVFILDKKKYRYGFTVGNGLVKSEWLYGNYKTNVVPYFIRNEAENSTTIYDAFKEAREVPQLELKHNLFLNHVASYKKSNAGQIWGYFGTKILISAHGLDLISMTTIDLIQDTNPIYKKAILDFLSSFNLPYADIKVEAELTMGSHKPVSPEKVILIKNVKYLDGSDRIVELNLGKNESDGTRKLFALSGIMTLCFNIGFCFSIDEIDSNFHPALLIKLIGMFNNPQINTGNAQLLFTTHDTNLLDPSIMRRDQFYFTEKNEQEATRLYSLADLKGIRNDADFARQYLAGFDGALPVLGNYTEKVGQDE